MTQNEVPLSAQAVQLTVVDAANSVLARLDTEKDVIRREWHSRPTLEDSKAARRTSFIGYATIDTQEYDAFDQYVSDVVDTLDSYGSRALDSMRAALEAYREKPNDDIQRARLAASLVAGAVVIESVRWHTSMAVGLYAYFHTRVPFFLLKSAADTARVHVTEPVIRACEAVLNGAPVPVLLTVLEMTGPVLEEARAYFEKLGGAVKVGADISRKVMNALQAAELVYSAYHAGLAGRGLIGGGLGPPSPPTGLVMVGGRTGVLLTAPSTMYGMEALLEHLAIVGGITLNAAMTKLGSKPVSSPASSGGGGEPSSKSGGEDPDDNYGGTVDYGPRSLPKPAPDDLYAVPANPKAAAAWQRQQAAYDAAQAAEAAGQSISTLPKVIMKRLGYFGMRHIYPAMIAIVRGGRGLAFFGGTVTAEYIRSLRGQAGRVLFIETSVRMGNRLRRLDAFEVTFGVGKKAVDEIELIDLTTTLRTAHVVKTADCARGFSDLGFQVTARDILLTDGVRLLDDLIVVPVPMP
jgi:hypothetical protein